MYLSFQRPVNFIFENRFVYRILCTLFWIHECNHPPRIIMNAFVNNMKDDKAKLKIQNKFIFLSEASRFQMLNLKILPKECIFKSLKVKIYCEEISLPLLIIDTTITFRGSDFSCRFKGILWSPQMILWF